MYSELLNKVKDFKEEYEPWPMYLFNPIFLNIQMESNINVSVRLKPLASTETTLWTQAGEASLLNQRNKEVFSFDQVFNSSANTQEIFQSQVASLIETLLEGFNVTVFAYGQTSSGKTFTMRGSEEAPGIIPLSIFRIFEIIEQKQRDCEVNVSYIEVKFKF